MKYIHTETNIPEENEYPKIVRDKIPAIIKKCDGIDVDIKHVKGSQEHMTYLRSKVVEEASELREAHDKEHLVEEIADVLEVIDAICEIDKINKDDILRVQAEKRQKRGGFLGGLIMNKKV